MPTSSSLAAIDKRRSFRVQTQGKSVDRSDAEQAETFLTIESALPSKQRLLKRSHSILNASSITSYTTLVQCDPITVATHSDGSIHISRSQNEKDSSPDRISLDRRGLTTFPLIDGELRLRLLSLQHNMITSLDGLNAQNFPYLVFLDIYDNQLEQMGCLNALDNLRVLLIGKNRLRRIEGLEALKKVEVLDLHGNQITNINGLNCLTELKVLNLAGNQIRVIGPHDFQGLLSLQELNLRRNRLRKLLGFGETPNIVKLFISNNELQSVEDISSLAKATNLREISIDNNPVFLSGDCVSFLVSYLHQLNKLNTMQITDQVRKAAMAWRKNKESTNSTFMDLTSDVSLTVRREEIISNARTNWELLRSQTKCLTTKSNISKSLNLDSDLILAPFRKGKTYGSITSKVPLLTNKKIIRTNSQDTDNSHTSSSNASSNELIRLPPILVPLIKKMEQKVETGVKLSGSLSSISPNVDSSLSSLITDEESSDSDDTEVESEHEDLDNVAIEPKIENTTNDEKQIVTTISESSTSTTVTAPSTPSNELPAKYEKNCNVRSVKSAVTSKIISSKGHGRAVTAKPKKQSSPCPAKDREQGGDYLIEICGRHLNIYGQCALRFIDKPWNASKANDVTTVKFNYVNFNGIAGVLNKLKMRFPNVDNFYFKETNIHCLGQLNALAEIQGLCFLHIDTEGNPITGKNWRSYAIYRLHHWGLNIINGVEVTEEEVKTANFEYGGLSDLVLGSLPDALLQPLLSRLRLDVRYGEQNAKKWLLGADPELRSVVSKEALQWRKSNIEDTVMKQKAKQHMSHLLDEMCNSVNKLRLLDQKWPCILHEFVRNALLDYSQLDMYMKKKISELK